MTTLNVQQVKQKLANDVAQAKRVNQDLDQKLKNLLSTKDQITKKFPDDETNDGPADADAFIEEVLENLDNELNDHILNLASKGE